MAISGFLRNDLSINIQDQIYYVNAHILCVSMMTHATHTIIRTSDIMSKQSLSSVNRKTSMKSHSIYNLNTPQFKKM